MYFYTISDGGPAFRAKELRKQMQNRNFTDRNAVPAKGLQERKQNRNFTFFFTIETHFVGEDLCKAIQMQTTVLSPQF